MAFIQSRPLPATRGPPRIELRLNPIVTSVGRSAGYEALPSYFWYTVALPFLAISMTL